MLHRPEKKENRGALALGGKGGKQNCWDGPAAAGREPQQLSWVLTHQQDWSGFTRFRIRCKSTILCSAASHLVGWALGWPVSVYAQAPKGKTIMAMKTYGSFRKLGVPYFGVLIIY